MNDISRLLYTAYDISKACTSSARVPFFGWKHTSYYQNLDDVRAYMSRTVFTKGIGTSPEYESYDPYRLITEQFARGGTVFTFEHLSAPDSIKRTHSNRYEGQPMFTHVRIRTRFSSGYTSPFSLSRDIFMRGFVDYTPRGGAI